MAIPANFHGNLIANDEKAPGAGLFGTTGLSGMSDFATHPDVGPRRRMTLKTLAVTVALAACASPALAV